MGKNFGANTKISAKGDRSFLPLRRCFVGDVLRKQQQNDIFAVISSNTLSKKFPKDITHLLYATTSKDKIGIRHLPRDDARRQSPEHLRRR